MIHHYRLFKGHKLHYDSVIAYFEDIEEGMIMDDSNGDTKEKSASKPSNLTVETLDQPGNPGWSGFLFSPFYTTSAKAAEGPPPTLSPLEKYSSVENIEAPQVEVKDQSEEIERLKATIHALEEARRLKKVKHRERKARSNASANPELFSIRLSPPMQSVPSQVDIVEIMEVDDTAERERYRALEDKLIHERKEREKEKKSYQDLLQADVEEILRLGGIIRQHEHQIEILQRKLEENHELSDKSIESIHSERQAREIFKNELSSERDALIRQVEARELKSREEALAIRLSEEQNHSLSLQLIALEQEKQASAQETTRLEQERISAENQLIYMQSECERVGF